MASVNPLGLSQGKLKELKCNYNASTNPGNGDDSNDGYSVGSRWFNTSAEKEFVCLDASVDSAVWLETTSSGGGSSIPSGTVTMFGGASAPTGWLICDGTAVSRSSYSDLFGIIGTTYGNGDGSTTFNLPDLRDLFPIGKSSGKVLGSTGGNATINLSHTHTGPSHTHSMSHHTHLTANVSISESQMPSHNHSQASHSHSVYVNFAGGGSSTYVATWGQKQTSGTHLWGTNSRTPTIYSKGSGNAHSHGNTDVPSDNTTGSGGTGDTGSAGSANQNILNPYLAINFIIKT